MTQVNGNTNSSNVESIVTAGMPAIRAAFTAKWPDNSGAVNTAVETVRKAALFAGGVEINGGAAALARVEGWRKASKGIAWPLIESVKPGGATAGATVTDGGAGVKTPGKAAGKPTTGKGATGKVKGAGKPTTGKTQPVESGESIENVA